MAHRGPDGHGLLIQGSLGFACQLLKVTPESVNETQPLVSPSGVILVWDGRLDNRAELLDALADFPGIRPDSPDTALVLAAYEVFREGMPERLAGDFALGLFDPVRQLLLLARDPIGIRSLHYARIGSTFVFASEIKALLAHPRVPTEPNETMLAEMVLSRYLPGTQNETCFAGISSLPPAFVAILDHHSFVTRRYWDFDTTSQLRLKSFEEYAEGFREHFERAVRRRIRSLSPVAVQVSGGLDSSSIFCLAETLRRSQSSIYPRIHGVSYVGPDGAPSDEHAFLDEIEHSFETTIERVPRGHTDFVTGAREEAWHVETPLLDPQWSTTLAFLNAIKGSGARVYLTGHWGDQFLSGQGYLADFILQFRWREILAQLKELARWCPDVNAGAFRRSLLMNFAGEFIPDRIGLPLRRFHRAINRGKRGHLWYTPRFRALAREQSSRNRHDPRGSSAHAMEIYHEARSTYHVHCMEWNAKVAGMQGLDVAFPFLDRDLIVYLMSIPGEMSTWQGRHKSLLREAMQGILPAAIAQRRGKSDFTDCVNEAGDRGVADILRYIEEDGVAVRSGFVQLDVVRKYLARPLNRMASGDARPGWSLRDLLGLELWLHAFSRNQNYAQENAKT